MSAAVSRALCFTCIGALLFFELVYAPNVLSARTPPPRPSAAATATPTPLCATAGERAPAEDDAIEAAVLKGVNAERRSRRLRPLVVNVQLTQAARLHARDMAKAGKLDHAGTDGSDLVMRLGRVCYGWRAAGENIAAGYGGDVKRVVKGWMDSPPHRAAILNKDYAEIGIGYSVNLSSTAQHYFVLDFGTQR
jgi:uncharacterized protein YkwD